MTLPPTPDLYSYEDFSKRFPLANNASDQGWINLLLRFRKKELIKRGKHYEWKSYGHMRWAYSLPAVVRVICLQARLPNPTIPTCVYLYETYYNDFCDILSA